MLQNAQTLRSVISTRPKGLPYLSGWPKSMPKWLYSGRTMANGIEIIGGNADAYFGYGDLGPGFYTTLVPLAACEWAKRAAQIADDLERSCVIRFDVRDDFLDNLTAYAFGEENAGTSQLRYLNYDCLVSYVDLPFSQKSSVQLKFQTQTAVDLLNRTKKNLVLFPETWQNDYFKKLWHLDAIKKR